MFHREKRALMSASGDGRAVTVAVADVVNAKDGRCRVQGLRHIWSGNVPNRGGSAQILRGYTKQR